MSANPKILIVDDDQNLLRTLSDILKMKGYAPLTAANGKTALDIAVKDKPTIALIDLQLPDISGLQVMKGIQKHSQDTENIVITGHASQESAIKAVNMGAYGYLQKPYDTEQLLVTVRRAIEKQAAAEVLRESEERYRSFVQNFEGIAFRIRIDMTPIFFHGAVEAITGYTEEELTSGRPRWDRIIPPEDLQKANESLRKVITSPGSSISREYRIIHKGGHIKYVREFVQSVCGKSGRLAYIQGAIYDITAHKRMEKELRKIEKLESLAILAGGIAHDFNNILMVILGNVSLAKAKACGEDERVEMLAEAEKAALQAKALTRQLLTFSKGGAPVKETASVSEIIKESCSFALRGSRSRCDIDIPHNLWTVDVDVGQISQVLNNFILNSHQAMPHGGVISIRAENMIVSGTVGGLPLRPGRYIRVSIHDQGVGISEKNLPKIFDPFFTTKEKGSGLGLASAYSIIKGHGGHIAVESRLGAGTTFHIYLSASEKKISDPKTEENRPLMGRGRILIMDDEEMIRKVVGTMLKDLGYETEYAEDGEEAIKKYEVAKRSAKSFDAVIMDLTIPGGMGGKEAIKKLREIDPEVKVVASSGYSNHPIMSNFREHGFNGVVAKPYRLQEMSRTLHEIIMRR